MSKKLLIAVNLVNFCFILLLLFKVGSIDSDKSVTLLYFYYPILLGVNLLLGIVFQFVLPKKARVFFISTGILLLAAIPIIFIVSTFE